MMTLISLLRMHVHLLISCVLFDFFLCTSTEQLPAPLPGKQSLSDKLELQNDHALIEDSFVERSQKARFLASLAPHSGDWLLALPIANCSLGLDDEAERVAVGMRLGLALCPTQLSTW